MDLRKSLFGNIVLSGGSTLTKGFGDRLLHEVQRLAVKDMRIKIFAPPERKYSTWIGGSILAGLSTFRRVSHPILYRISWISVLTHTCRCGSALMTGKRIPRSFIRNLISGLNIFGLTQCTVSLPMWSTSDSNPSREMSKGRSHEASDGP